VPEDFQSARAALLQEGDRLKAEATALDERGDHDAARPLLWRRRELRHRYADLLPEVAVARSPDSGEIVHWAIDTLGLDGWNWSYRGPARRIPERLPRTWLTMSGAMRLCEPVEVTPFVVRPGPGVPFVVPRIMNNPGVRAVIAQLPIGRHTGWPITYFGPKPRNTKLVNLWGNDTYQVFKDGEWLGWEQETPWAADYDFDLEPWLRSEKLLWIRPGDESMELRTGVDGCPYAGLDGVRDIPFIENGEVRYAG
jgi:hypothetical protein